jgi:hypothetical protein
MACNQGRCQQENGFCIQGEFLHRYSAVLSLTKAGPKSTEKTKTIGKMIKDSPVPIRFVKLKRLLACIMSPSGRYGA